MQIASADTDQQALSASARQYYSWELVDHLLNEIKDYAIFMVDKFGITVTWNPGVERLLGYSESEFIGQPFAIIFAPDDQVQDVAKRELETAKREGRAEDQRWHQRKDGTLFWANGLVTASKDEEGAVTGFVKIMRDQTVQKRLELQVAEYAEQVAATNQQLLKFAGLVSHDLNAPLQSVRGFATIVQEKTKGTDVEVDESVQQIVSSAERMLSLVNELLHFSKDSEGFISLRRVESEKVFTEVLENLNSAILSSRAVITHDSLPAVMASAVQLNRVFQNLIDNAIKYAKPGVTPRVHVSASKCGSDYLFRVVDNGIGLDELEQARLFTIPERFAPASTRPGFGIGLAAAKRVIELMGGSFSVESRKGEGSTFMFSLPVASTPGA